MKDRIKVLCFDFDLTLFDHDVWAITPSALDAIRHLQKDYKIVIASGRNMHRLDNQKYLEILQPDGAVDMNGAQVWEGRHLLKESCLAPELVERILRTGAEEGWNIGTKLNEVRYCTNIEQHKAMERKLGFADDPTPHRPWQEMLGQKVHSLWVFEPYDIVQKVEKRFPEATFMSFSDSVGADVIPKGVNKANGLQTLLDSWGYDFSTVMSFGDSRNDIPLLEHSGISIAMGNASDAVKEYADHVTDHINEDGVLHGLRYYGIL